jgi:hypothetical protein
VTLNLFTFSTAAELSPSPELFEPTVDLEANKEDEIIKMAEAILDEAIAQLLNETADAVFKEE